MPTVKTNNINIYYESAGSGDPLILITGFAQNSLCWEPFIKPLSQKYQVITFDLRGSGRSDSPVESYSIEMFVSDVIGLMDALKLDSAHFMGISMGTVIIQKLCLANPDRVKKSVLCAPFASLPPIAKNNLISQLQLLTTGLSKKDLFQLNASWLLSNNFLKSPDHLERYLQMMLSNPFPQTTEGVIGQADALLNLDLTHEIANIPHHLLLLVGEEDITTPPHCAELIEKALKNCKMHVFKQVGHLFIFEIPEKVTKKVLEFLSLPS